MKAFTINNKLIKVGNDVIGKQSTTIFPASGLTGYWSLDETSGTYVVDKTGNNYNGSLTGTIPRVSGINNGAFEFSISNRMIQVAHSQYNSFTSPFSISYWIYPTAYNPSDSIIIHKGYWPTYNYTIGYDKNGSFNFNGNVNGSSTPINLITSKRFPLNNWYNVVCIAHNDSNGKKIYVNGSLEASAPTHGTWTTMSNRNCYFGRFVLSGNNYYALIGKLDEIAFWNRALSEAEVLAIYNSGNGTFY